MRGVVRVGWPPVSGLSSAALRCPHSALSVSPAVSQLPGMSRLRRVSSLQSPAPIHNIVEFSNSDLHVHDIHNVSRSFQAKFLYMVKRSSLFWILWIKSCFADEGINSESFKHAQYWLELESLMSFLPSLVNNNVKMGELYNIDTTQACPSTAPT